MTKNKKTAPSAATLEAVSGLKNGFPPVFARFDYTTSPADDKKNLRDSGRISGLLHKGEENAIRSRDLVKLIGAVDRRALQMMIAREREDGELILSTSKHGGGYFLPDDGIKDKREIEAFVWTLRSRAGNTIRILKTAERELKVIDGQTTLEEDFE